MLCLVSLLYTPGQLRDATTLPIETYRHWKKALAPLRRDRGHSPSFSPGDLVAVSVIRMLTDDLGIRVGALGPVAEALFALCNQSPWPVLERSSLMIELATAGVWLRSDHTERLPIVPLIIVPLADIVEKLREAMLATGGSNGQGTLRFPPTPMAATARSRA